MPTFHIKTGPVLPKFSILHFLILSTLLQLCITSNSFETVPQIINSNILFGDAKNLSDNSSVQLTAPNPSSSSTGLLIWRKPIFPNLSNVSFSTDFTFSISRHNGHGLAFLMFHTYPFKFSRNDTFGVPKGIRFFGIEFHTLADTNVGDVNDNHLGIDVNNFNSVELCDLSKSGLVLKSGIKMHSWINYDSSSKRLEVRLGKFGSARPYNPLIAYQVDFGEMWGSKMVSLGLSSSSGKSLQSVVVYSWNVRTWIFPNSLHSQPLDPQIVGKAHGESKKVVKKKSCFLRILLGMIFVTGCGALTAFTVLSLWAIISSSNQTETPVKWNVPGGNFRYKKVNVVVEDSSADIKK